MDNRLREFFHTAREVRLRKDERDLGYKVLLDYMQTTPVRLRKEFRRQWQRSDYGFLQQVSKLFYKPMAIVAVLAVALMAGGGISLAAEDTAPGDILYPVKIEMNERVRAAFAVSQEAKAEWKGQQVERRLQEAESLAVKARLDSNVAARLHARLEDHVDEASQIAADLQAQGKAEAAAEIHSNLQAALQAHEKILAGIQYETNGEVEGTLEKVRVAIRAAQEARGNAESEVSAKADAEVKAAAAGKLRAAKNKIAEVKSFLERKRAQVRAESMEDASLRVDAAEKAVAEGEASTEAGSYGKAFVSFQEAIRVAQEAKALVQAGLDLKGIELRLDIGGEGKGEGAAEVEDQEEAGVEGKGGVEVEGEVEGQVETEAGESKGEGKGKSKTEVEVELGL